MKVKFSYSVSNRRRQVLGGLLGTAFIPAAAQAQEAKPKQIVVNDSGGSANRWMRKAYHDEFERRHGIRVVNSSPVNFAKLRAMVESGNVEWTVTEIGAQDSFLASELGLVEPIDDRIVDRSKFPERAREKYFFSANIYSTVMAYRKDAFKPGAHPKGWAAFWDVKRYPGPRAMRNHPVANLEFALLASGVPVDKLYPLDLDRAFKQLDLIKREISVWWTTGAQPAQLLLDKEVVLTTGWHGRFFDLISTNAPVAIEWTEGALNQNCYVIPKGAKDAIWGQRFLALMAEPQGQAVYAQGMGSPGNNPDAMALIDPKIAPLLPTAPGNLERQFWTDNRWWGKNGARALERWNEWMLKK